MENKFEEAYLKLLKVFNNMQLGINTFNTLEIIQQFNTIKELVDKTKTSTLEEIKQEWEEMNCEWMETDRHIFIHSKESSDGVTFPTIALLYKNSKTYTSHYHINIEIHKLLTKTIKMLGWFDNE